VQNSGAQSTLSRALHRLRVKPGIEDGGARFFVVAHVAGYDGKTVVQCGCGDNQVGMADLAAVFDQQPPLEHDILAHREDALFEHRAHLVREPIIQFRAAGGVGDELDSESYFGERYGAHIEQVERLPADEFQHLAFGLGPRPCLQFTSLTFAGPPESECRSWRKSAWWWCQTVQPFCCKTRAWYPATQWEYDTSRFGLAPALLPCR